MDDEEWGRQRRARPRDGVARSASPCGGIEGFRPLLGFPDLYRTYESSRLFPLYTRAILVSARDGQRLGWVPDLLLDYVHTVRARARSTRAEELGVQGRHLPRAPGARQLRERLTQGSPSPKVALNRLVLVSGRLAWPH